jgi:hypothetical protein
MPCRFKAPHLLSRGGFAAIFFLLSLSPNLSAQLLVTTDSGLKTGTPVSATYNAPGTSGPNPLVHPVSAASKNLWMIVTNPWGVTSGTGTIAASYSGTGTITTSVSLSGLPGGGVDGSPFTLYGCDQWFGTDNCTNAGGYPVDQPVQFPKQLSAMSSLIVDYSYVLSGTITGTRDIDMIWDEWVCRTGTNIPNGPSDCLEVEVLPYYNFALGHAGTFIRTFSPTVTLNGSSTTLSFDEYVWGQDVLYFPHSLPGLSSAAIRFDMLPFLTQAVADCNATPAEGCNPNHYSLNTLAGMEAGTEFGGSSTQSYMLTISKLDFEQTLSGGPAAPTGLTAVVQ